MRILAGFFVLLGAAFFVGGCALAWESRGAALVLTWPVAAVLFLGASAFWGERRR